MYFSTFTGLQIINIDCNKIVFLNRSCPNFNLNTDTVVTEPHVPLSFNDYILVKALII